MFRCPDHIIDAITAHDEDVRSVRRHEGVVFVRFADGTRWRCERRFPRYRNQWEVREL